MKNAIIFHGTGETPESFWIPNVKNAFESKGYLVEVPHLPHADEPTLEDSLPVALAEHFDDETVLIAHSSGCALILSVLERLDVVVHQAILVAGFIEPLPADEGVNPMLQDEYDWEKIRAACCNFIFINSGNDPWGCDDRQGRMMFDKLGGSQIILQGEGHMGSDSYNQPYKEFPLLVKLID